MHAHQRLLSHICTSRFDRPCKEVLYLAYYARCGRRCAAVSRLSVALLSHAMNRESGSAFLLCLSGFSRGSQENRQRELGRARFMSLVRRVALDQVILCEYRETPLYRRISQPSERGPLMSNIVTRATVDGFLNLQRNGVESFCRCRRCCFPFSRTGAREVEIVPCTAGRAIPDTSSPLWRPIWEA